MLRKSKGRYTPEQIDKVETVSGVRACVRARIIHEELCRAIGTPVKSAVPGGVQTRLKAHISKT